MSETERPAESVNGVRLEGLLSAFFTASKNRWGLGLCLGYAAILGGAALVLLRTDVPWWAGVATALVAGAGSVLRWWGDSLRGKAEELLRAKEYRDGIGLPVDRKRYADLKSDYSRLTKLAQRRQDEQAGFYQTNKGAGPEKLIEMLRESSWWTERLATTARQLVAATTVILVTACVCAFPLAELSTGWPVTAGVLIDLYTVFICLIFSGDLARLFVDYGDLAAAARDSYLRFRTLLEASEVSRDEALIAASTYQLARRQAPPIPDWLWRSRRATLNSVWDQELSGIG